MERRHEGRKGCGLKIWELRMGAKPKNVREERKTEGKPSEARLGGLLQDSSDGDCENSGLAGLGNNEGPGEKSREQSFYLFSEERHRLPQRGLKAKEEER